MPVINAYTILQFNDCNKKVIIKNLLKLLNLLIKEPTLSTAIKYSLFNDKQKNIRNGPFKVIAVLSKKYCGNKNNIYKLQLQWQSEITIEKFELIKKYYLIKYKNNVYKNWQKISTLAKKYNHSQSYKKV